MSKHRGDWLVRPRTIRILWVIFAGVLGLTLLADFLFDAHGHFGPNDTFGFNAWYGLLVCVAMIILAKGLGLVLKRRQTYYTDDTSDDQGGDA